MSEVNFKISYLELIGQLFTGVGVIFILEKEGEKYELLLWIDDNLDDKLIIPKKYLEKYDLTNGKNDPDYNTYLQTCIDKLPLSREEVLKEVLKDTNE